MEKSRIRLGLSNLTVDEKIALANKVIERLTTDPQFAGIIDPSELIAKRNQMEARQTARDAKKAEAKSATDSLNAKEEEFDEAITVLARNVENLARGNAAVSDAAGFDTYEPGRGPSQGIPPEVRDLFLTHGGNGGQVLADWKAMPEANGFRVQYTLAPIFEPNWVEHGTVTASRATLNGLESGSKYWVRVAAVNGSGQGPWSDPATIYAP